jgi:hypothetical protein
MKIKALFTIYIDGKMVLAGQSAIVDDVTGSNLIAEGMAVLLSEDERGGFAVPMETGPE